ncbi:hypothetical protein CEXT_195781 [Caerostris extrusa]|uniref:Uncharacterized protein n=1 Tax=Caerostris extrusa TaxID=172846 RepID=A0AAV4NZU9_CAEEX|nr:hypothetical protein CEXT_195781 [Caerostris extrusa]
MEVNEVSELNCCCMYEIASTYSTGKLETCLWQNNFAHIITTECALTKINQILMMGVHSWRLPRTGLLMKYFRKEVDQEKERLL